MSAAILRPPVWRPPYELHVWLQCGIDFSGPTPVQLESYWEVARCPDHMDWIDPLAAFPEDQRAQAVAWAHAYAASHPDHFYDEVAE